MKGKNQNRSCQLQTPCSTPCLSYFKQPFCPIHADPKQELMASRQLVGFQTDAQLREDDEPMVSECFLQSFIQTANGRLIQ